MEYLTPSQLDSYEAILEEINCEHEKTKELNCQISKEEDKITALNVALEQEKLAKKICFTDVMIFDNVFEIYSLYKEHLQFADLDCLSKLSSCKYYLIEVHIASQLIEKIVNDWYLDIQIYNETFNTNKVLKLVNQIPIMQIVPVSNHVINCVVDVKLFCSTNGILTTINLSHSELDISYHIQTYKSGETCETLPDKFYNLTKLYNENCSYNLDILYQPVFLEYKFNCNLSKEQFSKLLLKNSIHRLDVELFSELANDSDKPVSVPFTIRDGNKCIAGYDKKAGSVKLKGTFQDLYLLKKYILKEMKKLENYCCKEESSLTLTKLSTLRLNGTENLEALKSRYEEYRRLVYQLYL